MPSLAAGVGEEESPPSAPLRVPRYRTQGAGSVPAMAVAVEPEPQQEGPIGPSPKRGLGSLAPLLTGTNVPCSVAGHRGSHPHPIFPEKICVGVTP